MRLRVEWLAAALIAALLTLAGVDLTVVLNRDAARAEVVPAASEPWQPPLPVRVAPRPPGLLLGRRCRTR
jgi:hypothetical protein